MWVLIYASFIAGFIMFWLQKLRSTNPDVTSAKKEAEYLGSPIWFDSAQEWLDSSHPSANPFVPNFRGEMPKLQQLSGDTSSIKYDTMRYLEELQQRVNEIANGSRSICPFVEPATKANYLKIALMRGIKSEREIIARVRQAKEQFLPVLAEIESSVKKSWLCYLLVFPDAEGELIQKVKYGLKQEFLDSGLMVGEFFQTNPTKSIRSDAIYPRRSGHPIIAIRQMIDNDINFLQVNQQFVEAYLANFQGSSSANVHKAENLYRSK